MGSGKTSTKHLLLQLGLYAGDSKLRKKLSGSVFFRCIMKVKWNDGRTHWILNWNSKIHDPILDQGYEYSDYVKMISGKGVITSYLLLT